MNKMLIAVILVAIVVIIAGIVLMSGSKPSISETGTTGNNNTAPEFNTGSLDSLATGAEASSSEFVNEATPTDDQVVPDYQ